MSTEEYKAGQPLHNKSLIDFTDLFGIVKLISEYLILFFSEVLIQVINSKTFVRNLGARYEKEHDLT